jgi:uncharacterized protein DUF4291
MTTATRPDPPLRQIRAAFDDTTVTVYQAYSAEIADPALRAGTFVPPFKLSRMTWIKPSFFWMMYRSGWGSKPGQGRILAIHLRRKGFDQALGEACLSHYEPTVYPSHEHWLSRLRAGAVRVQWDPERSAQLQPLPWRSIQIGLSGSAVQRYVQDWIVGIEDVTERAHELHALTEPEREATVARCEQPYPLSAPLARTIGATGG